MNRMPVLIQYRIPAEMKKGMEELPINWPERIRRFIGEVIQAEQTRRRWKAIDKINSKHKRDPRGTAVKLVREMRDNA